MGIAGQMINAINNRYECGGIAQAVLNGTDKINLTPPKRYIYLVYEDIHGYQGAYGNKDKATQAVKDIAFGIYELEPETPLDYDGEECWGWFGTAWWDRIEVID